MHLRIFIAVSFLCVAAGLSSAQSIYFSHPRTTPQRAPLTVAGQKNVDFVLDWWREVVEARHTELAANYAAEDFIQHNPNIPTGRAPLVAFFNSLGPAIEPIPAELKHPPVVLGAKDDFVWLVFEQEGKDPHDNSKTLHENSFDLLRVQNGKVQEHWDSARKQPGSPVFVPSTAPAASLWLTSRPTADEQHNLELATRLLKDVYQYGHIELMDSILAPDFINHNLTVPAGREGLKQFLSHRPGLVPQKIQPEWKQAPVLAFANGPYVFIMSEKQYPDPADAKRQYTRNSFEVLRIRDGSIVEDWS